jgi:hypothetical protein
LKTLGSSDAPFATGRDHVAFQPIPFRFPTNKCPPAVPLELRLISVRV